MKYDVSKEYVNIDKYSPFSHVNEVSPEYQKSPFLLPFILRFSKKKPVHPNTLHDLNISHQEIIEQKLVNPTSSFRTVYYPDKNLCYKLPLQRRITRGIRDLSKKELLRSERANELLSSLEFKGFHTLSEKCHYATDPDFNYIIRHMPEVECFPWFFVIKSQEFDTDYMMESVGNIIKSWMFFASKDIFLEYHTQNILVDNDSNIYYRDLSDIRSVEDSVLRPSYYSKVEGLSGILATIFDRAVCCQNLNHLFRYSSELDTRKKKDIKELIESEIKKYQLPFPDYSMDFPKDNPERVPHKIKLIDWRNFK